MLALYRDALRLRRELPALGAGSGRDIRWLDFGEDVLGFAREPGFVCVVNTGGMPVALPAGDVVLASGPLDGGRLPSDAAAWIATR
jgi:alpha-glucosidase